MIKYHMLSHKSVILVLKKMLAMIFKILIKQLLNFHE